MYRMVCLLQNVITYVSLQHTVVFFLSAKRLFQNSDVSLIVLVLLF